MVQSSRSGGIGIKRHYPLMINNIAHSSAKSSRNQTPKKSSTTSGSSPTGPVIHEIDPADFLEECVLDDQFDNFQDIGLVSSPSETANASEALLIEHDPKEDEYNLLLTASPHEVNPAIISTRYPSKSKALSSKTSEAPKSLKKPINKTSILPLKKKSRKQKFQPITKIKPLQETIEEDIPLLADDSLDPESLEQATEAAISAISKAANRKRPASESLIIEPTTEPPIEVLACDMDPEGPTPSTSGIAQTGKNDSISQDMTLACTTPLTNSSSSADNSLSKVDIDTHVDSMQNDLDSLKELLKGEGYSLDANTLLGVCNQQEFLSKLFNDDPLSYGMPILSENENIQNKSNGNELMTYNPDLDLNLLLNGDDPTWITENLDEDLQTPNITLESDAPSPKKRK